AAQDRLRLLRALGEHGRDGGRGAQGQAQGPAVVLLSGGRVRYPRSLRRRARPARGEGRGEDLGDQAHRAREGGPAEVRRRGQGAGGRAEAVTYRPIPLTPSSRAS